MEKLTKKQLFELEVTLKILRAQANKIGALEDLFPANNPLHKQFHTAWLNLLDCRNLLENVAGHQRIT